MKRSFVVVVYESPEDAAADGEHRHAFEVLERHVPVGPGQAGAYWRDSSEEFVAANVASTAERLCTLLGAE